MTAKPLQQINEIKIEMEGPSEPDVPELTKSHLEQLHQTIQVRSETKSLASSKAQDDDQSTYFSEEMPSVTSLLQRRKLTQAHGAELVKSNQPVALPQSTQPPKRNPAVLLKQIPTIDLLKQVIKELQYATDLRKLALYSFLATHCDRVAMVGYDTTTDSGRVLFYWSASGDQSSSANSKGANIGVREMRGLESLTQDKLIFLGPQARLPANASSLLKKINLSSTKDVLIVPSLKPLEGWTFGMGLAEKLNDYIFFGRLRGKATLTEKDLKLFQQLAE